MGLQICRSSGDITSAFRSVTDRSETLFGNAGMFAERFIQESRHIEVQVFGDGQGGAVAFGERECSIQRRHQKVVEECPSPFVQKRPGEWVAAWITSCFGLNADQDAVGVGRAS